MESTNFFSQIKTRKGLLVVRQLKKTSLRLTWLMVYIFGEQTIHGPEYAVLPGKKKTTSAKPQSQLAYGKTM